MVTKYMRETVQDRAAGTHGHGQSPFGFSRMSLKQRLLVVYLGIAMFSILLLATHVAGLLPRGGWGPVLEGRGMIVEKARGPSFTGEALHLAIVAVDEEGTSESEGAPPALVRVVLDKANWDRVSEGTAVQVRYQYSNSGRKIRVLRIALGE